MKALFTAAGSIGSRHIKNLTKICNEDTIPLQIDVLRKTDRVLPNEIKTLVHEELRETKHIKEYDVGFITSETKLHYEEILKFRKKCHHLFIEKPVLDNINYNIEKIKPKRDSVYYVACPIRFSKYFEETKKVVDINEVYSARMIFSSYMPGWQKGRDYRTSFRCFLERGGGVDIDSLHEIDMMTALFGFPKRVERVAGKYSNLEMNAPDLSTFIFEYEDKVVEMHLDYFGRVNTRYTELFCRDDVITIDFNKGTVNKKLNNTVDKYGNDDQFYEKEMKYFVTMICSKDKFSNINTIDRAYANLKLAKGCVLKGDDYHDLF